MKRKRISFYRRKKYTQKQKRRLWLLGITAVVFFVCTWCATAEKQAHISPSYSKVDITSLLQQEQLAGTDYELLFLQTGLSKSVIDFLRQRGRGGEILDIQNYFFQEPVIVCSANTIISREERSTQVCIPYVEEGDILITFNSHVLGWRNGHAAIVVDGATRSTLEARVLGMDSKVMSMEHWEKYPSFAVLRLKDATKEERSRIAEYAEKNLAGIPYHLTAGWGDAYTEAGECKVEGTHCSHLVWWAYKCCGYDLDSDGGLVVTPRDIFGSQLLEVVQVHGMDATTWK